MRSLLPLLLLAFNSLIVCAQAPVIQWQKSYGGAKDDIPYSIQQTIDGGYIIAGQSNSVDGDVTNNHGNTDYWITKISQTGSLQWQQSFGGSGLDYANSVVQTSDGGYIVAGTTASNDGDVTGNHGGNDCWIVKLTSSGAIQWEKAFGGTGNDLANSIVQTTDGGYIFAASSNSTDGDVTGNHGLDDFWVVKLSATGLIQWEKSFGGTNLDEARSIAQTADGGYIVAGRSASNNGDATANHGSFDFWILKLSTLGVIQWQKSLGGGSTDAATSIAQTADGGYIVAGTTDSNDGDVSGNHGGSDYWLVKLSSVGVIQWQKTMGGTVDDNCYSVQQTADNGYVVAGYSQSSNGDVSFSHGLDDYWIAKVNSTGIIQWEKSVGGTNWDDAFAMCQAADGAFVIAGYTQSCDGDVTLCHGSSDFWIVKLNSNVLVNSVDNSHSILIMPNPTTGNIFVKGVDRVRIQVYNMFGIQVKEEISDGIFSIKDLPEGLYLVKIFSEAGEMILTDKLIKQ